MAKEEDAGKRCCRKRRVSNPSGSRSKRQTQFQSDDESSRHISVSAPADEIELGAAENEDLGNFARDEGTTREKSDELRCRSRVLCGGNQYDAMTIERYCDHGRESSGEQKDGRRIRSERETTMLPSRIPISYVEAHEERLQLVTGKSSHYGHNRFSPLDGDNVIDYSTPQQICPESNGNIQCTPARVGSSHHRRVHTPGAELNRRSI